MFYFLRGIITEKVNNLPGSEKLILDVGGVGYEIQSSLSALDLFGKKGDTATVYTALIHKEDQMSLIGFPTLIEKELFNLLISVSGIGPKTALNLLNNLTVSEISYAILNEDVSGLSCAQGIGERTASRIILELKEKIQNWQHLPIVYKEKQDAGNKKQIGNVDGEARSVLQALGYSSQEINQAFSQAKENGDQKDPESLIHFSLKWLASVKR